MDASKLNTKTGATKGAFLHLKHPALGHRLWTGAGADDEGRLENKESAEKVGLKIIGFESERIRQRAKQLNAEKLKRKDDGVDDADAEEEGLEFLASLVTEVYGLTKADGTPLTPSKEDLRYLFDQSDDFGQQIMTFAQSRANFYKASSTA